MIGPGDDGRDRIVGHVMRWRWRLAVVTDSLMWALGLSYATWARLEFDWSAVDKSGLAAAIVVAVVTQLVVGYALGIYLGRWQATSFEGVGWTSLSTLITASVVMIVVIVDPGTNLLPRSAIGAGAAFQLVGAMAARYLARLVLQAYQRSDHERTHRVIVFGAGEVGREVIRALREDRTADLLPVAFVDDDPSKSRLRVRGVPVAGTRADIAGVAARYDASVLLLAVPSADHDTIAEVAELGIQAGLAVRVVPRLSKFLTDPMRVADIREIRLSDFLSRDEVDLDIEGIQSYLEGKRVLVTGAAGSIGSELCATIRRFSPERLLMLDISENGLHSLALRLDGRANLEGPELILGDVCDPDSLRRVFERFKPQVVFHAAARKHVAFLEKDPEAAFRTNVVGTRNVLRAASEHRVERLVNISTDKAADPVSVLGLTKRIGEMLTAYYGRHDDQGFMSVRFGNVLGSDGSVVQTFRHQLMEGVPLTVTHPDVTRYFMTIQEAVGLVVQAGAYGGSGEVLVLDMGEPIKIVDLARRLAAEVTPGARPEVVITGLGQGEKLHETLLSSDDVEIDRPHEKLMRVRVPDLAPSSVSTIDAAMDGEAWRDTLAELAALELPASRAASS